MSTQVARGLCYVLSTYINTAKLESFERRIEKLEALLEEQNKKTASGFSPQASENDQKLDLRIKNQDEKGELSQEKPAQNPE